MHWLSSTFRIALIGLFVFSGGVRAQDSLGMRRAATKAYWEGVWDMGFVGNIAYVPGCVSGLHVMDFSDPTQPLEFAWYDSVAIGVSVSGNLAYISAGSGGMVLDVTDPMHPQHIGDWYDGYLSHGIFVHEGIGIVTDGEDSCPFVLDASDPENVQVVGDEPFAPCYAEPIGVVGGYYCLIGFQRGLRLYDLSNPEQPVEVSVIFPNGSFHHGTVSGNFAYLLGFSSLGIVDFSNPLQPVHVATCNDSGECLNVTITGNHAVIAKASGISIWNVTDPTNPFIEGSLVTSAPGASVFSSGEFVYLRTGYPSLTSAKVIDISNPTAPVEVGTFGEIADLAYMTVQGTLGYVVDYMAGLRVFDLADAANPIELGCTGQVGYDYFQDVAVNGNFAYVAAGNTGIITIDVSEPTLPQVLSSWHPEYTSYWRRIVVGGGYAYGMDEHGRLHTFSLADPAAPVLTDTLRVAYWGHCGLSVANGYLYVVYGDEFYALSLANPAAPEIVGTVGGEFGCEIAISGQHAYVCGWDTGPRIVDIANPAQPMLVGELEVGARAVAVSGHTLITKGSSGLIAWDITNPVNPEEVGYYTADDGSSWLDDLEIVGNHVVTAHAYRLRTYECNALLSADEWPVSVPQEFSLRPCYPNPFNSMTTISLSVPVAGPVRVVAYDLQGRMVTTLVDGRLNAGEHRVRWDASGLASGVYFVRMTPLSPPVNGGRFESQTRKVVLLK